MAYLSYRAKNHYEGSDIDSTDYQSTITTALEQDSLKMQVPPHFGVLLLDADAVEYANSLSEEKILFKMKIPERTYGRISGLEWDILPLPEFA